MSRVLIIYASHYGQTRSIAEHIAKVLRLRDHHVDVADARRERRLPSPKEYDAVVLGSRVELGRHASDVLDYVRDHRDELATVPTAFFSVSMSASEPRKSADPSGYMMSTFELLGWHPAHCAAFAGALPYRRYGWLLRFIMKRISRSAGHTTDTSRNHEFTDWTAVATFADKVSYIASGTVSIAVPPARPEARSN